ncbi:MAG TPA: hypothetical protein VGQ24_15840 [Gemmatimonadales bacterium]|jgi:phage terminase Nu1 subunit (DNA packaging protein)|nr:hypothetical protein [Gemmatimonadales bacterium]
MAVKQLTRKQACSALGEMPVRTFALLCSQGLPRKGDGQKARFPWPEIHHWYIERERKKAREEARPKTLDEARKRREAAEAQIAEIDLEERLNTLVSVDSFKEAMTATHMRIRAKILAIPSRVGPMVVGLRTVQEAVTVLERETHNVMAELRGEEVHDGAAA